MTPETPSPAPSRKRAALAIFLLVAVSVVLAGLAYWRHKRTHIATDDAFVEGRIHVVASRVAGTVVELLAEDNRPVRKGDVLLRIDPEPFEVREAGARSAIAAAEAEAAAAKADVSAAGADLEAARRDAEAARRELEADRARLVQADAAVDAAKARVGLAAAQLAQAARDADRAGLLFERGAVSRERHEKAQTALDVARAQQALASEELRAAEAAVPALRAVIAQKEAFAALKEARAAQVRSLLGQRRARVAQQEASVAQRRAVLDEARLNRRYTEVVAPADGYVTRRGVEVGQVVAPGQSLLSVTPLDNLWIVANYKETQVGMIRPGQRVTVVPDSYRGRKMSGKVDSIMAGTGSAFSLFPPENATGNYVKVVQRVPVKIVLDPGEDPGRLLRVGMSVVPTVHVE